MACKFLQMGYTRARRYANHPTGRKYVTNPQKEPSEEKKKAARKAIFPQAETWGTGEKAESARIFYGFYLKAREDEIYKTALKERKLAGKR